ncbi:MAG: efflux RND transporter permease subunit, partial [Pseudomonadota bacterium]
MPVATTAQGQVLRIADLGIVSKTQRTPSPTATILNGQQGIVITAVMEQAQRVDMWAAAAKSAIAEFQATAPSTVEIDLFFDQSIYTQERLVGLVRNFGFGIALVILVLFVLMGWRSAVMVGLALPLSVAVVLGVFNLLSVPLHQMSVTGMIIALGLLIDNAIVVIDEIDKRRARGLSVIDASAAAVKHLQVPLAASSLTTALTFAPIMLSPGGVGDFIGTLGLAVILALISSMLISLTILPALSAFLRKRFPQGENTGLAAKGYRNTRLTQWHANTLDAALRRPRLTMGLSMVLPVVGFVLAGTLVLQFFPPVDRNQFQIQVTLPAEASINRTQQTVRKLDAVLADYPEITDSYWFLGEGAPKAFYNALATRDGEGGFAGGIIETTSAAATRRILPELQR